MLSSLPGYGSYTTRPKSLDDVLVHLVMGVRRIQHCNGASSFCIRLSLNGCRTDPRVQWELASASIAIGLGWRQALPAVALGHLLIALVITANGPILALLHLPFPFLIP